jgi:hypothetical protein
MDAPESFETDESRTAAERARAAANAASRPDWLVGADEGVEGELERRKHEAQAPAESPALRRPAPDAPDAPNAPAHAAPPALRLVPPPAAAAAAAPARPEAWKAAASSLPTLRVVKGAGAAPAAPGMAPPPRAIPAPTTGAERAAAADADPGFPDDDGPGAPAPGAAPEARTAPPREAWWAVALDALRSDRRWQALAGALVVLAAVVTFWPRGERAVPIGALRRHPERWDGASVHVTGRVGEVFPLGGGYAFYLHQGRDTMVVFTRTRRPVPRQRVAITGSISTGYLDGAPRQALFEDTH